MTFADGMARWPHYSRKNIKEGAGMIWTIIGILVVLWLIGLLGHIGGGLIYILLVIALVVFIYDMLARRRT
jgi:4-hydroxybenzoate polyprenyltransferase